MSLLSSLFLPRSLLGGLFTLIVASAPELQAEADALSYALASRIEKIQTLDGADGRLQSLQELAGRLTPSEIDAALAAAATLQELRCRAVFHDAIVTRWSKLAPAAAWQHIARGPESRGVLELIRIGAQNYAALDPIAAAHAVQSLDGARLRLEAIPLVAESWARSDPQAALQWARSLPSGPAQELALQNIRFVWVHADPAAAAKEILQTPPGDIRRLLVLNLAGAWAARDLKRARAWVDALAEPAEKEEALIQIVEAAADRDPTGSAQMTDSLPPALQPRARAAVAARWATQHPRDAADWVSRTFVEGERSTALVQVFSIWTTAEPESAVEWVRAQASGPGRDAAVEAYVQATFEWSPRSAALLALEVGEPALRIRTTHTAWLRWAELDPAAALAWLNQTDLPAGIREDWSRLR